MEDRLPISDNECEEIVLGTIISTQNSFEQVGDILDEDCFYAQRNKDIFASIKAILRRGDSPDLITIRAELEKTTSKMSVSDIIEVYEKKTTFELNQHSLRLKELSIRRKMYELSYYLLQSCIPISYFEFCANLVHVILNLFFFVIGQMFKSLLGI